MVSDMAQTSESLPNCEEQIGGLLFVSFVCFMSTAIEFENREG